MDFYFYIRVFHDKRSVFGVGSPTCELLVLNPTFVTVHDSRSSRVTVDIDYPNITLTATGAALFGFHAEE